MADTKQATPVPIVICCPLCGCEHWDEGEWATRPHKTHQCQSCQHEWRPFEFPTVGVSTIAFEHRIKAWALASRSGPDRTTPERATCQHCGGLIVQIYGQWEHVSTLPNLHLGIPPEPKEAGPDRGQQDAPDEKTLVRQRVRQYKERIPCGNPTCKHVHLGRCAFCDCLQIEPAAKAAREGQAPKGAGWIAVEERLPEFAGTFIVAVDGPGDDGDNYTGTLPADWSSNDKQWRNLRGWGQNEVTHWQPLPAPPLASPMQGKPEKE